MGLVWASDCWIGSYGRHGDRRDLSTMYISSVLEYCVFDCRDGTEGARTIAGFVGTAVT